MVDAQEFDRWRRAAQGAVDTARLVHEGGRHAWTAFLSEQSGRLGVRGLLHGLGRGPDAWGHDLVFLLERTSAVLGSTIPDDVDGGVARLSRHYTPARYPDLYPEGTPEEHYRVQDATTALEDAERILAFVDETWRALAEAAQRDEENHR